MKQLKNDVKYFTQKCTKPLDLEFTSSAIVSSYQEIIDQKIA